MPKISESKREERRQEILEAALRCFLRTGYQKTSMADIIAESGLSAGAIYGYFASKRDIIHGVAGHVIGGRRSELLAASADHPLSPAEIAGVLINGLRAHVPVQALVQVWAEAIVDPELRALLVDTISGMRGSIAAALEPWAVANPGAIPVDADPVEWARSAAPVVMSLIPGFALQRSLFDDFDEELFLRGLSGALRA